MNWKMGRRVKKFLRLAQKFQTSVILVLIGLLLIGTAASFSKLNFTDEEPQFIPGEAGSGEIKVDIAGAVGEPGVYTLSFNDRLEEAIVKAGGLSPEADSAWVAKNLNLAAKLIDGQKIYIPTLGEVGQVASQASSKININTATKAQLESLPDIGEVRAEKIIASRPYASIEELLNKKVVGSSTFEKIKNLVSIY